MALFDEMKQIFPWIEEIGLSPAWFQNTAATSASSAEIVAQIRSTPQYKMRFPGLSRADSTLRMTEAQYIQQETAYRQLLQQYGFDVAKDYKTPATLIGFFEGEIAPSELQDRLSVFKQVQEGGQRIKDSFYVYAGLNISDDDLYEAIVDPAAEQNLKSQYNQAVAAQPFDYATWISRATYVGLHNVANQLSRLQGQGAVTAEAVQRIQSMDPQFAQQIMDVLYTGGDLSGQGGTLSLQELLDSFEFAAIGAAAQNAGLELPTRERLSEIRAAGVERSKAISAYQEFGRQQGSLTAAIERARGTAFGQREFEAATFLGDASAARDLEAGLQYQEAASKQQGAFRFDQDNRGRFRQAGFTNY